MKTAVIIKLYKGNTEIIIFSDKIKAIKFAYNLMNDGFDINVVYDASIIFN